jgi:hypothetical protein
LAKTLAEGEFRFNAYAIQSKLDLYSNFMFFHEHRIDLDPAETNGDQFEQAEHRRVFGLATSRRWNTQSATRCIRRLRPRAR